MHAEKFSLSAHSAGHTLREDLKSFNRHHYHSGLAATCVGVTQTAAADVPLLLLLLLLFVVAVVYSFKLLKIHRKSVYVLKQKFTCAFSWQEL